VPTVLLYELSIYAVKLAEQRHASASAAAGAAKTSGAKPAGKPA
jgi:hypothetical protein